MSSEVDRSLGSLYDGLFFASVLYLYTFISKIRLVSGGSYHKALTLMTREG